VHCKGSFTSGGDGPRTSGGDGPRQGRKRLAKSLRACLDPHARPIRPERHVTNSIATMRKRLTIALAKSLYRCPCCHAASRRRNVNARLLRSRTMSPPRPPAPSPTRLSGRGRKTTGRANRRTASRTARRCVAVERAADRRLKARPEAPAGSSRWCEMTTIGLPAQGAAPAVLTGDCRRRGNRVEGALRFRFPVRPSNCFERTGREPLRI
jgi:hypothetical protein